MPQLAGRSQSGGSAAIQLSGSEGGHYANVPPQMQRSATTPYGAGLSILLPPFAQLSQRPIINSTPTNSLRLDSLRLAQAMSD
jgi:hypothetical protein